MRGDALGDGVRRRAGSAVHAGSHLEAAQADNTDEIVVTAERRARPLDRTPPPLPCSAARTWPMPAYRSSISCRRHACDHRQLFWSGHKFQHSRHPLRPTNSQSGVIGATVRAIRAGLPLNPITTFKASKSLRGPQGTFSA